MKALGYALFGEPKEQTFCALGGPNPESLGCDDIKKGDKFCGYACGCFFDNQVCTGIREDGYIYGTTTLAVFKKEMIIKLK